MDGWKIAVRYFIYAVVVAGLAASLPALLRRRGLGVFTDGSVVEWAQFTLLGALVGMVLWMAVRWERMRRVSVLLCSLLAFAATREMDYRLDEVPVVGWKFAYLWPLGAIVYGLTDRATLWRELDAFVRTRAFAVFWAGLLLAVPVGQLVGHTELLVEILGDGFDHHFKHAIEEILETFGYLVIAIACMEYGVELEERDEDKSSSRKRNADGQSGVGGV